MARAVLPISWRQWLRPRAPSLTAWPPVGAVRFGALRWVHPVSHVHGFDRGIPIDRYYIEGFLSARLIGYDNSIPMLERARQKIKEAGLEHRIDLRCGDLNGELSELPLEDASMVTMCWTMQFIRPLRRDNLIRWIYSSLVENGALVVTDKILTNSTHINFETMVDRTEAVYTELLGAQVDVAGLRSIPYYPPGKIH